MLCVTPQVSQTASFFFIWLSECCSDWNLQYNITEHSTEQNRFIDREQNCGCSGGRRGREELASLGLADANYYVWDG